MQLNLANFERMSEYHSNKNTHDIHVCEIEKCVENYTNLSKNDYHIQNYNFDEVKDELNGYLGDYYKGIVKYDISGKDESLYLFVKSIPKNELRAKQVTQRGFFKREKNVYSRIFPRFTNRQDNDKFIPRCLLTTESKIFFEDLNVRGYKNISKRDSFNDEHCYVALSQIAKFHAESMILEESTPNNYKIIDEFSTFLNQIGYAYTGWYLAGVEAGLAAAKISANRPVDENIPEFEKKWKNFFKIGLELCQESKKYRNVLCHRDLWCNNLMFRYNEQSKPVQCIIVDFQACGYMPPAGDVVSFIYLNIFDQRRHLNFEKYLKHYHEALCSELKKNELNPDDLIHWNVFRDSCEEYKKLALLQCIILHQLSLIDGKYEKILFPNYETYDYLMEISRNNMILYLIENDNVFKEKFMFSVDEIIKLCL